MRAICKVCNEQSNCSYIKRCKEGECIDVQTSDYGYEEAVDKACKQFCKANCNVELCKFKECEEFRKFKQAMEL